MAIVRKKSGRKRFLIGLVTLVLLVSVLLLLEKTQVINLYSRNEPVEVTEEEFINYSPPTDEERQAGDNQKDATLQDEEARKNAAEQQGQKATVIITDAGQYADIIEVRAFIPDYYQDGTCTITFTKDSLTVTKDTPAYRDVSTTICTNPNFARSEFQEAGDWQLAVNYTTSGAHGSSASQTVTIR